MKLATSDPGGCWAGSCRSVGARLAGRWVPCPGRPLLASSPPFVLSQRSAFSTLQPPEGQAPGFHRGDFLVFDFFFSRAPSLPTRTCIPIVPTPSRWPDALVLSANYRGELVRRFRARDRARSNNTNPTAGNDELWRVSALQLFLSSPGLALSERKIGQSDETRIHASTFPGNTDGHKSDRFPFTACQTSPLQLCDIDRNDRNVLEEGPGAKKGTCTI